MLHVIWTLIKIILLILAVLLGAALLLLLGVLFIPVRYQAAGKKEEAGAPEVRAKLSWLGSLINLPVSYQDGVFSAKLRIFGFSVLDFAEEEESFTKEEPFTEEELFAEEEPFTEKKIFAEEPAEKAASAEPFEETASLEEEPFPEKRQASKKQETAVKRGKLKCTFDRICDKIKRIRKKYKRLRKFAEDERTKAALRLVREQAFRVLSALFPRKAEGWILFGTDDPALTGEILGAISIFYPFFMDTVKITPDFERAVLEGDLSVRGRFYMITAARAAWKLFRDRNVRWTYRMLKRL